MCYGTHTVNPSLYAKLGWDAIRDFTPITLLAKQYNALVVHPSIPARTVNDLVALVRKNPGKLSYASSGSGSPTHLGMELFKINAQIDMTHIPYKGAAPSRIDLLGGHVDVMFDVLRTALPYREAGRTRMPRTIRSYCAGSTAPGVIAVSVPGSLRDRTSSNAGWSRIGKRTTVPSRLMSSAVGAVQTSVTRWPAISNLVPSNEPYEAPRIRMLCFMTHIAYKGTGPALNDLLGGQIQLIFGSAPATIPLVRANRLRAIAVTTTKRSPALPDLPTVAEGGVPGYEVVLWYGVLGPKGLPKTIVDRWNTEIRKATKIPDLKERLISEGFDIDDSPPSVFQATLKRDVEKWQRVVRDAKVKPQ